MPQIDREGIFKVAAGGEHGLEEVESGAVAIAIKFRITHMLEGANWVDWDWDYDTWARVWIVKKDGTLNETGVRTACDVLGWNNDLDTVGKDVWKLPACQVHVKSSLYEGKTSYKAESIYPLDYVPDSKPKTASPDRVQALKARYGAQLRAMANTKPAPAPAPANKPPPLPRKNGPPPPPPPPPQPKGVHGTKQRAWTAFCEATRADGTAYEPDYLAAEWQRIFEALFPGRDESSLAPTDWLQMEQEGRGMITPF